MQTIIETLKQKKQSPDDDSSQNELLDANDKIKELEAKVDDLEDELEAAITPDTEVKTSLGSILIKNETGNLQLQMEIDDFVDALKEKY